MDSTPDPKEIVGEYDFVAYSVRSFDHLGPEGTKSRFNVLYCPDWTNVLVRLQNGQFVLVRQFRYAMSKATLELPGGIVGHGQLPIDAAREELREETGFLGGEWTFLGSYLANPGLQNNLVHAYFCSNPYRDNSSLIEVGISTEFLSREDFFESLYTGELCQAFSLSSIFMAKRKGLLD